MPAPEVWVAFAFLCFLGLLAYLGVYRKLIDSLDQRQTRIKGDLDEAKRLREEAQALLAEFERKGRAAETEASAATAHQRTFAGDTEIHAVLLRFAARAGARRWASRVSWVRDDASAHRAAPRRCCDECRRSHDRTRSSRAPRAR